MNNLQVENVIIRLGWVNHQECTVYIHVVYVVGGCEQLTLT